MELDRAYDRFTPERERDLRDLSRDPWDTAVQRLLDHAICGEKHKGGATTKQLYALVLEQGGRRETFYEFQPDNPEPANCCFHGYPVPEAEVPTQIARALRKRTRELLD